MPANTELNLEIGKKERMAWLKLRPLVIWIISIVICVVFIVVLVHTALDMFYYPADPHDARPIVVMVPRGSGASTIAKILYEAGEGESDGLIKHSIGKAVFKIYVDFTGKASKLKAGTYILSRNMDMAQIVDIICEGNPARYVVRFTIAEGMKAEDIAKKLIELDILEDDKEFLELCRTGGELRDEYDFLKAIKKNGEQARDYLLEGYLFPDTYEVYTDATPHDIIKKMLNRFKKIFKADYITQAEEMGLSIDDVVNFAALIEKEAKTADFEKTSAVFHNRLKINMKLQSDAPLNYIHDITERIEFSAEEKNNPSLYNTHVHKGLPLGPICNPGENAIKAVLNPHKAFMQDGEEYYYFCLTDQKTGLLAFAKTLDEHNANVAKYKPYW